GSATIHAIEDVHHYIDRLILPCNLIDVEIDLLDVGDRVETIEVILNLVRVFRYSDKPLDKVTNALLHQLRDTDPEWVILHTQWGVELESLLLDVEVQALEGG